MLRVCSYKIVIQDARGMQKQLQLVNIHIYIF